MMNGYDTDVVAWANEQAAFIRAGRFDLVDIEHIADEIEDVGKSEFRALGSQVFINCLDFLALQGMIDDRPRVVNVSDLTGPMMDGRRRQVA